ncbi:MAG: tetratricopeptide repeat protein [Deltaproteobacteria bacterium]|nr:MAG: tetratricopeptide repeat protein [Deltaproteobacteria bacterium]
MILLLALLALGSPARKADAGREHREKGLALEEQGRDDAAAAEFGLAVQVDPSDAIAQHELGKILFKQGDLPAAVDRFQAAVKLDEKNATAWYNLAYASRKSQQFALAAQAYQKYTELSPDDPDGYFGWAESLRQSGQSKEALDAYRLYIAKEKRPSEQKWVERSKEMIAQLEPAQAPPAAPSPAAAPPAGADAARARIADGDRAFEARDYRAALFAYQDAILADSKNVDALVKAGNAYVKLGHDEEAGEQWSKALQLDPQNAVAREALAALRERRVDLRRPGTRVPAPPLTTVAPPVDNEAVARTHYGAAVGLIRDRKYSEAVIELNQALSLKPSWTNALIARGSARIGLAKYDDAIADYLAAQKADPSLAAPLFGLAEAYRGLGQAERAAELYRQFAASNAPDAQASLKQYALQNAQALSPK